jgi:hypothetical protein
MDSYDKTLDVLKKLIREFRGELVLAVGLILSYFLDSLGNRDFGRAIILFGLAAFMVRRIYFWK